MHYKMNILYMIEFSATVFHRIMPSDQLILVVQITTPFN